MMAILLAALVGLLVWAAVVTRRGGQVPWGLVVAAAAIPPLMVATSLWEAGLNSRFGDVRMSLKAIQADEGALAEGISLGGGEDDLLRIDRLPAGLVQIRAVSLNQSGKADQVEIWVNQPARAAETGVVRIEPQALNPLVNIWQELTSAHPLIGQGPAPSRLISAPGCELHLKDDRLSNDQRPELKLPPLSGQGLFGRNPEERIFSLRTFGAPEGAPLVQGVLSTTGVPRGRLGCSPHLWSSEGQDPSAAFIFKTGAGWRAMFLNPRPAAAPDYVLRRGSKIRLRLYRVQYADDGAETKEDRVERIVERRSVVASLDDDGLTLRLDTPEILPPLRAEAIGAAVKPAPDARGGWENLLVSIDQDRTALRPPLGDASVNFESLGGRFRAAVLADLRLRPTDQRGGLKPVFIRVTGGAHTPTLFGASFWAGQSVKAQLQIDRLGRDVGVLALIGPLLLGLATIVSTAASWRARRASAATLTVLAVLETLLSLRLLIAISGAFVDGFSERAGIVTTALVAWLIIPFLASLFLRPAPARWARLAHGGFVVFISGLIAWRYEAGMIAWLMIVAAAVFGAIALLRPLLRWGEPQLRSNRWRTMARRLIAAPRLLVRRPPRWSTDWIEWLRRRLPFKPDPVVWRVALCILLLFLIRMALWALGIKEGFIIPGLNQRVAVSLLYLPLAIVLTTALLYVLHPRFLPGVTPYSPPKGAALIWLVGLAVTFAVGPALVKDIGFMFFGLGVGIVCALVTLPRLPETFPGKGLAFLTAVAVGLGLAIWSLLHGYIADRMGFFMFTAVAVASSLGLAFYMNRTNRPFRLLLPATILLGFIALALLLGQLGVFQPDLRIGILLTLGLGLLALGLSRRPAIAWALPVVGAVVLALTLHLPGLVAEITPSQGTTAKEQTLDHLRKQTAKTQNELRIWYNVQPATGARIGTSVAQDLGTALAHLDDYVACPDEAWPGCLFGLGYLAVPPPTILGPYHLDDNVSAIHLMAPFGRATALFLLMLLAAAPLICGARLVRLRGGYDRIRPVEAIGLATLWTVFIAALYMILANLQVLPFTGKNVYLLAAASGGDLIEGVTLLLLGLALTRGGWR